MKLFLDGDPTITLETFKELVRCGDLEEISAIGRKLMSALELGKRDTGATTSEQKVKSLKARWFKSDIGKKNEK